MTPRPIITEDPLDPRRVVRASRTFCRAVRELRPPSISVSQHDMYRTREDEA
jgi:hypothetical protein